MISSPHRRSRAHPVAITGRRLRERLPKLRKQPIDLIELRLLARVDFAVTFEKFAVLAVFAFVGLQLV